MSLSSAHILTPSEYVSTREGYGYSDEECSFAVEPAPGLSCSGSYYGVFAKAVPCDWRSGINLRRFEEIVQEVFGNAQTANSRSGLMGSHQRNLREITKAIVHWKNASQGRVDFRVKLLLEKWDDRQSVKRLLNAHATWSLEKFRIPGVAIPTASAFLRFLDPVRYGVIDSKVVQLTQAKNITRMNIRKDGYINNLLKNVLKYDEEYICFLCSEAEWLNDAGTTFQDTSGEGVPYTSQFRACDVEMALWQSRQ